MSQSKNILIAPLNWGLGHAVRCIPLIRKYVENGDKVIIASDGQALDFLREEFPKLIFEQLPAYNIHYAKTSLSTKLKLMLQVPKILKTAQKERQITEELVDKYDIDLVISDNRFGLRSNKAKSVYMTHQLRVLSGATTFLTTFLHRKIYKKYDEIWVPDFIENGGLSGKLGHINNSKLLIKYIGIQSRLKKIDIEKEYDLLAVLSGPEPQRSLLEKELLEKLANYKGKTALVCGVISEKKTKKQINGVDVYNYLTANDLEMLINASEKVIARSGYTSLMDYYKLQKKMILVPTPGQNEQLYLARYFQQKGLAVSQKQGKIFLKKP